MTTSKQIREKQELAGYMASLLTLLEHQDKSGVNMRSTELGAEFERCWLELKELIKEEQEDARQRTNDTSGAQAGAQDERSQSGRSGTDRLGPNEAERVPAFERSGPFRSDDILDNSSRR